jgi:hypothetical protein
LGLTKLASADVLQPRYIDYKVNGQIHRLTRLDNASTAGSLSVDPKRIDPKKPSLSSALYVETDPGTGNPINANNLLAPIPYANLPYGGFRQVNYPPDANALTYTGFHGRTHELPLSGSYNIAVFNPKSGQQLKEVEKK